MAHIVQCILCMEHNVKTLAERIIDKIRRKGKDSLTIEEIRMVRLFIRKPYLTHIVMDKMNSKRYFVID